MSSGMATGESERPFLFPPGICKHTVLNFGPSPNAAQVGYSRRTEEQRVAATTRQGIIVNLRGKRKRDGSLNSATPSPSSFPAPLVLPDDDLSLDPSYPPQSLRSWVREKERNKVTPSRNVIYVAAPPDVTSDVEYLGKRSHPKEESRGGRKVLSRSSHTRRETLAAHTKSDNNDPAAAPIQPPCVEDVKDYLAAFYHNMPVKLLTPLKLSFTTWDNGKSKSSKAKSKSTFPNFVGLNAFSDCTRIRVRPTANKALPCQLNLDDLLDAAIIMLPDDAYALLLLVNHDLYEDDDDEFVCGRAYGGSRVAVISLARYNPELDERHGVEREHAWPASHCSAYINSCCAGVPGRLKNKAKHQTLNVDDPSLLPSPPTTHSPPIPLQAALSAHHSLHPRSPASPTSLSHLYLSRVCRTASHELGHCFGMDHCVYYACSMQGSSSLAEDARQPPYLCPVDLFKVLEATGADERQRYREILAFCERRGDGQLFAAFGAWVRGRLVEIETANEAR